MNIHIQPAETILYVENQQKSRIFYEKNFRKPPDLACYFADPDGHVIAFARKADI